MELQAALDQLTVAIEKETWPETRQVITYFIEELKRKNYAAKSLQVGDVVDDFTLYNGQRQPVRLHELLAEGPVVLSFYRGGWCPYCNLALKALHYSAAEIAIGKAQLIAVSPEKPENILYTMAKNKLSFTLLSDVHSEAAKRLGIAITLPDYMVVFYRSFGLNLSRYNADVVARLPIPATYIIDTQYTIRYAFVEESYTQRADPETILTVLQRLENTSRVSYG